MAFFKNEDCVIRSEPIVNNWYPPFHPTMYAERKPNIKKETDMEEFSLTTEEWREYDFGGRVYRINNPEKLFFRKGGTTHRVVDADGVAHCVPAPGEKGCVLRWSNKDKKFPVNF